MAELWMPIVLSAVFVFLVSSVLHMLLPIHKGDFARLPDEEGTRAALRAAGVGPGDYVSPCPSSMKEMASPEMMKQYEDGPVFMLTVMPSGPPAMGRSLGQWFVFSVVVSAIAGYVTSLALPHGAPYMQVFRIAGTVAIAIYATGNVSNSIWKGVAWSTTWKFVFDGVCYGLVTAGTFAWLWPAAA